MPDIIYTPNYLPVQFDDAPEEYNRLRQKLQAGGTSSGSIKYQKGPSKGSSLSASRDVSDEARKKVIETKLQEQMKILSKYANRIHLDEIPDGKLSVSVTNDIKMSNKKALGGKQKNSDKSDRATANVYHAITEDGNHRAIKVYKTSILVFKDRDRYVTGEYRFRHGYSEHNPKKMVKLWAEKEMRNLKRLWQDVPNLLF
ncbi:unnamed protein product [Rhizophagus irregularis]|nr:unnamed protein product [Rhizophagus irregularis]